ncbi:MAG: hypothetical protein OEV87_00095 [Phycisphaerae bacterium]|nr:hypothetical protein [Phycisphaerae bacterium]
MLKTLRITSIIAVILAFCGAAALIFMGLKGNSQVKAVLSSPGIVEQFKDKVKDQDKKDDKSSPLVAQAKAFAFRIDPPPPPKPPVPKPKPPTAVAGPASPKPVIPKPKSPVTVKSDLVATVLYKSAPEKSLALLATTGGKQEWFRQGEKVGHLEIKEIRDGSVVFTQGGQNPQEKFVPEKTQVKSILKTEQTVSEAPGSGSGSIAVPRPALRAQEDASPDLQPDETTPDSVRMVRPIDRTASRPRPDVSERIQRVRSLPAEPTPQEQKEKLKETMSGIEEIMNRQDESVSPEEREKEKKMWDELMQSLKAASEDLDQAAETKNSPEAGTEPKDADESAASDPNESE